MLSYRSWSASFRYLLWFMLGFALIVTLVVMEGTLAFDRRVISFVQGMENTGLTFLAEGLSLIGSTKLVIGISLAAMALLFFILKHRTELVFFLAAGLGSQLLNSAMKLWFRRERPTFHRLAEATGYSFPSGHSMAAFTLYGALAFLLWRHMRSGRERLLLLLSAVLITAGIGWSRIYLGVHYPSDVIGGYAASGAWLMLCIACFEAYRRRRGRRNV
ncbi:phosphatase PAP2 family protein ['Paenibacillus yunnanensis' Narsing Rao et al. 2020]|uniref:phosphatase PAP2 family protein n=1 Tax=Paenibacillus tengchongensis TaxID=2608684 RepID=UPI00124D4E85|nr:phosphatase PAP2 family protein [Paenibacillus tengchongensis]